MCGPKLLLGRALPRAVLFSQLLQGLEYLVGEWDRGRRCADRGWWCRSCGGGRRWRRDGRDLRGDWWRRRLRCVSCGCRGRGGGRACRRWRRDRDVQCCNWPHGRGRSGGWHKHGRHGQRCRRRPRRRRPGSGLATEASKDGLEVSTGSGVAPGAGGSEATGTCGEASCPQARIAIETSKANGIMSLDKVVHEVAGPLLQCEQAGLGNAGRSTSSREGREHSVTGSTNTDGALSRAGRW